MQHTLLASACLAVIVLAIQQSAAGGNPATVPAKAAFVQRLDEGKAQKVVYFGTSLTAGGGWTNQFSAALEKAYPGLVTFHNGAKGGENSKWGLGAVQKNVIEQKADVVFIEFTTNDAVDRFHLSLAEAKQNTETIIDEIQNARPGCEIILQIMNPIIDRPAGHAGHRGKLGDYQQMYRDLGKQRKLQVIDHMPAWQKLLDQGDAAYRKFVPDGLHPNAEGYKQFVVPTILKAIGVTE